MTIDRQSALRTTVVALALAAGLGLAAPAPAMAAKKDADKGVTTMATTADLNMREGASLNSPVITTMPNGSSVEVYGMTNSGWYHVKYKDQMGWAYYHYLNFEGTAKGTVHDGKQTKMYATHNLNVRQKPSTSSRVLGSIDAHEAIVVNHKSDGWFTVEYKGKTGYCHGQYLAFTKDAYTADDANATAGKNVMNGSSSSKDKAGDTAGKSTMNKMTVGAPLNIRTQPDIKSHVFASYKKGEVINVLEMTEDGWCRVDVNGQTGWVYSYHLK